MSGYLQKTIWNSKYLHTYIYTTYFLKTHVNIIVHVENGAENEMSKLSHHVLCKSQFIV